MKFLRNLLVFLFLCSVLLVGMSFAVQNTVAVPLDLLFIQLAERSLALWVLLAFALGGVIGMLTNMGLVLRLRTSLMQARRKLRAAEKASAASGTEVEARVSASGRDSAPGKPETPGAPG
jgi:putative membrane protein